MNETIESKMELLSERFILLQDRFDSRESDLEELQEEISILKGEFHDYKVEEFERRQAEELNKLARSSHKWEVLIGGFGVYRDSGWGFDVFWEYTWMI